MLFWNCELFRAKSREIKKIRHFSVTNLWWTIQDSNLRRPAASQPPSGADPLRSTCLRHEVTSSRRSAHAKQNGHPSGVTVCFGGRYKTRTCDLPHVKRMRYQLRQSSGSFKQGVFYRTGYQMSSFFCAVFQNGGGGKRCAAGARPAGERAARRRAKRKGTAFAVPFLQSVKKLPKRPRIW